MDPNSGLPPEIVVLCTTSDTKEKAVQLLDWIRQIPDVNRELAWGPAIPAICSLIASEQLGNTVVTERRALQWSQSTPEKFKTTMGQVQRLLVDYRMPCHPKRNRLTLQALAEEFSLDQSVLSRLLMVEKAFGEAKEKDGRRYNSDLTQISIFIWFCRQFKIRTLKPVEDLQLSHCFSAPLFREIQHTLDDLSFPPSFEEPSAKLPSIRVYSPPDAGPSRAVETVPPSTTTEPGEPSSTGGSVTLSSIATEFDIGDDVMGGMRFLEKLVRERTELKDILDWNSTLGRCAIFYWTCSVLKIPSAKHITLRNRYTLVKKDFDKILSALDSQRADLRQKLQEYYQENPALQLVPQSTHWAATSPAKPQYSPTPSILISDKSVSPARRNGSKGTGKPRGRPPKPKSPPPIPVDPVSNQEKLLMKLCHGPNLKRSLLLLRSYNARHHPANDANRVPTKQLPALIALLASQQLCDGQISDRYSRELPYLTTEEFASALAIVRETIDVFQGAATFAQQTTFDALALEHGLGIDTVVSMMHVREALKASRCLSDAMDWDSPLVKCSVFFWTCAILKVPDVKQNLLRTRSLASKREFDSMLQLLNSHCHNIRQRLESDRAGGAFIFAPPPQAPTSKRPYTAFCAEEEIHLENHDQRATKRIKRETLTPSDLGLDDTQSHSSASQPEPLKPRRSSVDRRLQPGLSSHQTAPSADDTQADISPIYIPKIRFPPVDWQPPETVDRNPILTSECPTSEVGESKRRHTRYSTSDYQDKSHNRLDVWKPHGKDITEHQSRYREWEEKMSEKYGSEWERKLGKQAPGVPFE